MRFEALKFVIGREIRVFVIQMQHESDAHQIVAVVIQERPATRAIIKRPAKRVLDQSTLMFFGRDLPQFFDADAVLLRLVAFVQSKALDELLSE